MQARTQTRSNASYLSADAPTQRALLNSSDHGVHVGLIVDNFSDITFTTASSGGFCEMTKQWIVEVRGGHANFVRFLPIIRQFLHFSNREKGLLRQSVRPMKTDAAPQGRGQDLPATRPELPFILGDPSVGAQAVASSADATGSRRPATPSKLKSERRKKRTCKIEGCANYIVKKGLCCRHGVRPIWLDGVLSTAVVNASIGVQGGKQCSRDGCTTIAKHWGLCCKHGSGAYRYFELFDEQGIH